MTTIKALRILPPFAIGRLGSADEPMDNYTIDVDPPPTDEKEPLGYRALKPQPTLLVNRQSGEIERVKEPPFPLEFKQNRKISAGCAVPRSLRPYRGRRTRAPHRLTT